MKWTVVLVGRKRACYNSEVMRLGEVTLPGQSIECAMQCELLAELIAGSEARGYTDMLAVFVMRPDPEGTETVSRRVVGVVNKPRIIWG